MRACEHFSLFKDEPDTETDITQSGGHPWNGWLEVYKKGRCIYSSFRAGLFLDYLEHLAGSAQCREKVGRTEKEIREILERIEKAWEEISKDC